MTLMNAIFGLFTHFKYENISIYTNLTSKVSKSRKGKRKGKKKDKKVYILNFLISYILTCIIKYIILTTYM